MTDWRALWLRPASPPPTDSTGRKWAERAGRRSSMRSAAPAKPSADDQTAIGEVARGGALNLVGNAVYGGGNFLLLAIVTTQLGVAEAGVFLVAIALFNIVAKVCEIGAATGLIRTISRDRATGQTARVAGEHADRDRELVRRIAARSADRLGQRTLAGRALQRQRRRGRRRAAHRRVASDRTVLDARVGVLGARVRKPRLQHHGAAGVHREDRARTGASRSPCSPSSSRAAVSSRPPGYGPRCSSYGWCRLRSSSGASCIAPKANPTSTPVRVSMPLDARVPLVQPSARARSDVPGRGAVDGHAGDRRHSSARREAGIYAAGTRYLLIGLFTAEAIMQVLGPRISGLLAVNDRGGGRTPVRNRHRVADVDHVERLPHRHRVLGTAAAGVRTGVRRREPGPRLPVGGDAVRRAVRTVRHDHPHERPGAAQPVQRVHRSRPQPRGQPPARTALRDHRGRRRPGRSRSSSPPRCRRTKPGATSASTRGRRPFAAAVLCTAVGRRCPGRVRLARVRADARSGLIARERARRVRVSSSLLRRFGTEIQLDTLMRSLLPSGRRGVRADIVGSASTIS